MTKHTHTQVSCNLDKLVSVVDQLSSISLLLLFGLLLFNSIPAVPRVAYSGMCRQKKAIRKEEEKELRKREEENADGQWADNPRSVEDFERLLLTQGDTSIVWIRCLSALILAVLPHVLAIWLADVARVLRVADAV